ncbi:MAG: hypothetical protein Q9191_006932 [Dirinaria sp. TL-2023a]
MITRLPTSQARVTTSGASRSSKVPGLIPTVASRTDPAFPSASTSNISRDTPVAPVKVILGLVATAILISALVLSFCIWRRRRKSNFKKDTVIEETHASNLQPFFQQKPELHSEQARHEMPGDDIRHELDEGCSRNELVAISAPNEIAADRNGQENATAWGITTLQELRGLECSHELADDRVGGAMPMDDSRNTGPA